ncbi:response regulator [Paraflavisolibacter sp. H34]|uniref:response regulator n=1 Tax=Huijunlia imazamoxiresistens TaxID=3127457 RepID=UPI003016FD19
MQETNRTFRILLVDDDRDDCFLLQEALDRVAPQTALTWLDDAGELWETMADRMPGLIVLDYKLPKEDGIYWLHQLKAHPAYRHIPVVLWSTSSLKAIVADAYRAGAQQYLEKPWEVTLLADALQKIFKRFCSLPCSLSI